MLYHSKIFIDEKGEEVVVCSGKVHLNLGDSFSIFGHGVLNQTGLEVRRVSIEQLREDSELIPNYYCFECEENIPEKELVTECSHCHQNYSINKMATIKGISGMYCEEGIEMLKEDFPKNAEIICVAELLKTYTIIPI